MKRLAILVTILGWATLLANCSAAATARHDQLPLRTGSAGPNVVELQKLLATSGVFAAIKPVYRRRPNGYFGTQTGQAIYQLKWRLGYPVKLNSKTRPVAGPFLFGLLHGTAHRPPRWVAIAAHRLEAVAAGPTALALKIRQVEISQLGVTEQPPGSNWGPQVAAYQAVTGALHAAWCVSFQQWGFLHGGYGTFANDTASVYYAVDYAAARNWLHAKPKVGALVAFITLDPHGNRVPGTGHIGYVIHVMSTGFVSTEGNYANRAAEVFHPWHDTGRIWDSMVFLYLPAVA